MKILSLLFLSFFFASQSPAADLLDAKPRVAIMSAFEPEW
ncbi:hypothetical protein ABID21_000832 [Pseudorhizobium tarimense]|uniref:Uncharacterized protein n=1 Tax=Pseudorhizobium tarimense TaxID=1079109 RepID=A0ABV2H2K2_9HYPH